jgi:hypothetical protein
MAATTPTPAFTQTEALRELAAFPLVEALFGRRSRGFARAMRSQTVPHLQVQARAGAAY